MRPRSHGLPTVENNFSTLFIHNLTGAFVAGERIPELKFLRSGKVRDLYEVDDKHLLLVASDRISAFDCVMPSR